MQPAYSHSNIAQMIPAFLSTRGKIRTSATPNVSVFHGKSKLHCNTPSTAHDCSPMKAVQSSCLSQSAALSEGHSSVEGFKQCHNLLMVPQELTSSQRVFFSFFFFRNLSYSILYCIRLSEANTLELYLLSLAYSQCPKKKKKL